MASGDALAFVINVLGTRVALGENFGVHSNARIVKSFPSLTTPAGWTFAIWGPIFALESLPSLVGPVLTAATAATSSSSSSSSSSSNGSSGGRRGRTVSAAWPWRIVCLSQAAWQIAFGFGDRSALSMSISQALITSAAVCARVAYNRSDGGGTGINKTNGGGAAASLPSRLQVLLHKCGRAGLAVHSTWLSAALLVNMGIVARAMRLDPVARLYLARASAVMACVLGLWDSRARRSVLPALVMSWALLGIAKGRQEMEGDRGEGENSVINAQQTAAFRRLATILSVVTAFGSPLAIYYKK